MGNLDNLNFKVILDDKNFDKQIKKDLQLAKMLNTEVSRLLDLQGKVASATGAVATSTKKVADAAKSVADATRKVKAANSAIADSIERQAASAKRLNSTAKTQNTLLRSLKGAAAAYFSIEGARRFVSELVRITGEFEKQQVALRAILQDSAGADALFERIKQLAVVSPFSFLDLTKYAKQLSAFSVPMDKLYDTTKMLADVSAGLGVDMGRIILAYGQIRSASFLRGQEVRQLTEAGIPILDELAKQFEELEGRAVSVGEVFDKISARQVPFEMVEKAFKDMTSEGGKFYQMQEVLAETLAGKISNLRDSYQIMLSSMGNAQSGVLKGAVNLLTKMMNNYEQIGADLIALAATYGVYKLAVYATSLATKGFVKTNIALLKGLRNIKLAIMSNPYALMAAAAVAAGYAIYRVVTAESDMEKAQKSVNKTIEDFRASSSGEISNLDYLWRRLKNATVGTEEYEDARKRLIDTYGQHLTDIDKEALAVGNLADVYDRLKESVMNAEKEKAMSEGLSNIAKAQTEKMQEIYSRFASNTEGLVKGVKAELQDYVKGDIGKSDLSEVTKFWYDRRNVFLPISGETQNVFDDLRNSIAETKEEANSLRETLESEIDFVYNPQKKKAEPVLSDYEKRVKDVLAKHKGVLGLQSLSPGGKDYWTYIDDIRKIYAENKKKLEDAGGLEEGSKVVENIKAQNKVIEQIFSEAFGGKVSIEQTKQRTTRKKAKTALEKELEDRIRFVKEMSAQYSKMKDAGISDKTIREKFDETYPDNRKDLYRTFDFDKTLESLKSQLEGASSSVARSADAALRKDKLDSFTEAFKASSKAMRDWLSFYNEINENTPESSADSFGARVQRVLNRLSTSNFRSSKSVDKALTNLSESEAAAIEQMGHDAWMQYSDDGLDAIDRWAQAAKQANADVAQQSLQSLGKSYLDTFFTSRGINMNDMKDKSFGQLQEMLDKLNGIDSDNLIPEDVVRRAKELGVNVQPVLDFIRQSIDAKKQDILGAMFQDISAKANAYTASLSDIEGTFNRIRELKNTIEYKKSLGLDTSADEKSLVSQTELFKRQLKSPAAWMEGIAKATKTAAGYMKEFAEATGNTKLGDMADEMSAFAQNLGAAAEGFEQGGWIGAIVSGVSDMIEQTVSGIMQAKAYAEQLRQTMEEYRRQLTLNRLALKDSDYSSPFGEKSIEKTMDAYKKSKDAIKEYSRYVSEQMEKPEKEMKRRSIGLQVFVPGLSAGYGVWGEETQKSKAAMRAYLNGYNKLQGMMVKTSSKNGWQKFWGAQDKYTALKDLAPDLWDENGAFNVENATAFLNTSKQLTDEQKKQIQYAIDLKNAYDDAMKAIDEQIENTFGDMASELTDIIYDSVLNGSDAWDAFRQKGSETILQLGKELMQEMLMTEYLETYRKPLQEAYKSDDIKTTQEKIREITKNMYGGLMNLVPMLQESAESWIEWMKNEGFDPTASGASLANGIKSITEDTANLLASYINAIRSDVSQIRSMQAGMQASLSSLLEALPKSPTLGDYLARIEAHTANMSVSTAEILKQLRSVITTQGGSAAFAVYM
jgi:methyl-accepting chemotaxis protein|nr:MAG TPA: tail tape measure protein [Bacteriophage sp.]